MFQAVVSNPDHPDYGVVTIPFPNPRLRHPNRLQHLRGTVFKWDGAYIIVNNYIKFVILLHCFMQRIMPLKV